MSWEERWHRARAAWWLRSCERVGDDPVILGGPAIYAGATEGRIVIGHRFYFSSRPVESHLAAGPNAVLTIGDDVRIAHGAAIAAYERVEIGARTCIGPFVVIMDTNFHDGSSGDQAVHHDCRPVVIGRDCAIGSRVTIMRGVTIGDGAEILAGSVVSSSIPPGMCAGGARARVLGPARQRASQTDNVAAVEESWRVQ